MCVCVCMYIFIYMQPFLALCFTCKEHIIKYCCSQLIIEILSNDRNKHIILNELHTASPLLFLSFIWQSTTDSCEYKTSVHIRVLIFNNFHLVIFCLSWRCLCYVDIFIIRSWIDDDDPEINELKVMQN